MSNAPGRFVGAVPSAGLAVVALVYLWAAPVWLQGGDNAEYVNIGAGGGIAHPPGYPLFTLYLQATRWLPGTTPAHTAALATALLGIAAVAVTYRACRAWGASMLAALAATAAFAAGPLPLTYFVEAEVFALNCLFAAAILWLSASKGPLDGRARVVALALVGGLAASHHPTAGLMFPIGFVGVARGLSEATSRRASALAGGVAVFVVGLSPVLLFLTQSHGLQVWRDIHDLQSLAYHALRREYGVFHSGGGARVELAQTWLMLARSIAEGFAWVGVVPLVVGAVEALRRRAGGETRTAWFALFASVLLTGPALVARIEIAVQGLGVEVLHRFHLLPLSLCVPAVACGVDVFGAWLRPSLDRSVRPPVVAALAAALFPICAFVSAPRVAAHHSAAVERYVTNVLRTLPPDAVFVSTDDFMVCAVTYAQRLRGIRPDVVHINYPLIFSNEPYKRRVVAQLGFDPLPSGATSMAKMTRLLLKRARAVFLDSPYLREIVTTMPTYPLGTTLRVVERPDEVPTLNELEARNVDIYRHFELDYVAPGPNVGWHTMCQQQYTTTWRLLAEQYRRAGLDGASERCEQRADAVAPK